MKKTALTILLTMTAAVCSYGQGAYEALLFSRNDYEGTARSVAMGNAFTALGGDLGAVSINPAGSAVAGYSQLTLTPSITFASSTANGNPLPGATSADYFEKQFRSHAYRGGVPNVGLTYDFPTGRKSGIKNITFGFVMNQSNSWCEDVYANGTNANTSFAAAAAVNATENLAILNESNPDPRYTYQDYLSTDAYKIGIPWKDVVGYRGGVFSQVGTSGEEFIGATEILFDNGDIQQGGQVDQTYGRHVTGNKYDYIFNFGMNISDFIYVGANLGITSVSYDQNEYFKEAAVDKYDFENVFIDAEDVEHTTYFQDLTYRYSYSANGAGVYGKFGIIVTPGNGLRVGAAIQTPTALTITEKYLQSATTNFSDSQFSASAESPLGDYTYTITSPLLANFGVAYTLGKSGVFSADYEVADYSSMKYHIDRHEMSDGDVDYFESVNEEIRSSYGTAHMLRLGAELRPLSELAVRAGYNLTTSAMKDKNISQSLAFGLGYASKGSFFADLACRYSFASREYYMPYGDYQFDSNGDIVNYSPEILIKSSNWKLLLTLGWRF